MQHKPSLSLDTKISLAVFVVVFLFYFFTLCPTIYPGPSANAVCDVRGAGLTPPTSHPIWLILGRLLGIFTSNTAYLLNFVSAFFGALTIALLYAVLSQFTHTRTAEEEARYQTQPSLRQVAALSGALLVAFSHPFWEGSVLAGSDTLNTFLLVLICFLLARYVKTSKSRYAIVFGLVYGLALTNYPTLFLLAPIFIVFLLVKCRTLLDDPVAVVLMFICFGIGLLPAFYEARTYALQGKDYVIHAKTFGLAFSAFVDTYFRAIKGLFIQRTMSTALFQGWIFWLFLPTFLPILFFMIARGEYERGSPMATKLTYLVRYVFVLLFTVGGLGYLWGYRIGPKGMAGVDYLRDPRFLGSYVVVGAWLSYIIGYWLIVTTGKFKPTGTQPEPRTRYMKIGYIAGIIIALGMPVAGLLMNYGKSTKRTAKYAEHLAKGILRSAPVNTIIVVPVQPPYGSIGAPLAYFQSRYERSSLGRGKTIIDLNASSFDFYTIKRVEAARYLAETVFGQKVPRPRDFFLPESPFTEVYDRILNCERERLRALEKKGRPRPLYGLVNNFILSPFLAENDTMNTDYRAQPVGLLYLYKSRREYSDTADLINQNQKLWKKLRSSLGIDHKPLRRQRLSVVEEYILGEYSKSANDFGVFAQLAGERDLAKQYYDLALTFSPDNASALLNMASVVDTKAGKGPAERDEFDRKHEALIKERQQQALLSALQDQEIDFLRWFGLAVDDFDLLMNTEPFLAARAAVLAPATRARVKVDARRLGLLRLAADIVPHDPGAREKIGDVLLSLGAAFSAQQARGEYMAALQRTDPEQRDDVRRILAKLGRVYARLGNNSEAEKFYKKALDSDDPSTQLALMQFYLATDQKLSEVKAMATTLLQKAPKDEEEKKRLAVPKREAAIVMATVLLRSEGMQKAEDFLRQYLTDEPQQVEIVPTLATQLRSDTKFDDLTIWLLKKYISLRTELSIPWLPHLAELYFRQQRYDDLADMKEPPAAGPNTHLARLHYFKGLGYETMGKRAEAQASYEQARALLPEDSGAFGVVVANNLAWLYFKDGRQEQAFKVVQEAVSSDPANSLVWDTYGWIIYKAHGDLDKALDLVEASHLANPDVAIIAYHYGKLLLDKGLKERGIAVLQRAVELGIAGKEELEDARQILKGSKLSSGDGDSQA